LRKYVFHIRIVVIVILFFTVISVSRAQEKITLNNIDGENRQTISLSKEFSNVVSRDTIPDNNSYELLNKGYNYISNKQYNEAISVFNTYLLKNPNDTKISMQLGYLYDATKKYANAYRSFEYVADYSTNPDEIDKARTSMYFMKDLMIKNSVTSLDLYFYNFYDSYYQNYVANLLTHINVRVAKGIYMGPYLETYLDSKSKPDYILNDRFFDIGGFTKFNLTDWMNFEVRVGYVREIDFKKNSLSFKPILSMGTRLGQSTFYKDRKSNKTENFYFDVYASGLYDYKFRNVFVDVLTKEVLRYLTGGYSYFEFYLKQEFALDSKKLDYNNYIDLGAGIAFKPNILNFPVLFVEGLSRNYLIGTNTNDYFSGDLRNIFTVRAGFLIYYNTKL
jgi:tetratricopeptide (TPR) repeat protein